MLLKTFSFKYLVGFFLWEMLCFKVFRLQNFRNKRLSLVYHFSLGIYFYQKALPILVYIYEVFSFIRSSEQDICPVLFQFHLLLSVDGQYRSVNNEIRKPFKSAQIKGFHSISWQFTCLYQLLLNGANICSLASLPGFE